MNVIVSGGSSGIGYGIVLRFLKAGAMVFVVSRSPPPIRDPRVIHINADLGIWDNAQSVASEVSRHVTEINVLVNNVGRSEWRPLRECDEHFVDELFDLNVKSYISLTRAILGFLSTGASIVNVSSIAGKRGSSNNSVYCASKFAINGLTQAWAKELGIPNGIRVNAVCPVLVDTEGLRSALKSPFSPACIAGPEAFLESFKRSNSSLSKLPSVEDTAEMVYWLSTNEAGSITGQCINVDCGVFPQ